MPAPTAPRRRGYPLRPISPTNFSVWGVHNLVPEDHSDPGARERPDKLLSRGAPAGVLVEEKGRALVDPHLPKHGGVVIADDWLNFDPAGLG
jgi:hypothetical protein